MNKDLAEAIVCTFGLRPSIRMRRSLDGGEEYEAELAYAKGYKRPNPAVLGTIKDGLYVGRGGTPEMALMNALAVASELNSRRLGWSPED